MSTHRLGVPSSRPLFAFTTPGVFTRLGWLVLLGLLLLLFQRYLEVESENAKLLKLKAGTDLVLNEAAERFKRDKLEIERLTKALRDRPAEDRHMEAELMSLRARVGELTQLLAEAQVAYANLHHLGQMSGQLSNAVVQLASRTTSASEYARILEKTLSEIMSKYNLPEKDQYAQAMTPQAGDRLEMDARQVEAVFGAAAPFISSEANTSGVARFALTPEQLAHYGITNYGQLMVIGPTNFKVIRAK